MQFTDMPKNLEILAEECAEVQLVKSKIIRFGWSDCHPNMPGITNRDRLEEELGHVKAMIFILEQNGYVTNAGMERAKKSKLEKLKIWYYHEADNVKAGQV